ncbi:MAG: zinc ABC transporter substrate-binding protein [Pseudomonadota bacterium]
MKALGTTSPLGASLARALFNYAAACRAAIALGLGVCGAAFSPTTATAEDKPVRVVVSIAPVHGLVSEIMSGVETPRLLVPPGVSPHVYAFRPSDAQAVADADLIVGVGGTLEAWLRRPMDALAADDRVLWLGAADGVTRLPARHAGVWLAKALAKSRSSDASRPLPGPPSLPAPALTDRFLDPHLWLDPRNAAIWTGEIADALAIADPANATRYHANAKALRASLKALEAEISADLAPLQDARYLVQHDAYQYFEERFGLAPIGAIALSDGAPPSAAQLSAIQNRLRVTGAECIFTEPQFPTRLAQRLQEGAGARLGELDPLGVTVEPGPGAYATLLRGLAQGLKDCLSAPA